MWFREDDFPLLGWVRQVHSFHDFAGLMFLPYAQGTIRPLSERLPFLVFWNIFGEYCVPLRIFVFLTAVADLWLLALVTRRLTGSRLAGCAAAMFWGASAALITPMTWNSGYNEVQYQMFLLAALALFIRYADTGRRRWWWAQLAVFVVGLGSLENNVVYPALAVAWALLVEDRARRTRLAASTIPLFFISAAYYFVHMRFAPAPATGIYAMHFDLRIVQTLREYWRWAFLAPEALDFGMSALRGKLILWITTISFAAFLIWQLRARRIAALFGLAWFLVTFSPMLLLPDRHTEYYLAGPVMGLAMIAGWGVMAAWRSGWIWTALMLVPALAWFSAMIPAVRAATIHFVEDSKVSRNLVVGVEEARANHPGKTMLLDGISQQAYQTVVFEDGFRALGMANVYLTPGARETIQPDDRDIGFAGKVVDPAVTRHALENEEAVVFDFSPGHLKNVTASYRNFALAHFPEGLPRRVQVGNPLYAYLLGPEWLAINGFVRWMPGNASFKIAGPEHAGERIAITGFCWEGQLRRGPVHLAVDANGVSIGEEEFHGPDTRFESRLAIPPALTGKSSLDMTLRAWPVAKLGPHAYGVMVESIAIQ
jgi:hypothetical protein